MKEDQQHGRIESDKSSRLELPDEQGKSRQRRVTEAALSSVTGAAFNAVNVGKLNMFESNDLSLTDAIGVVREKVQAIQAGDMSAAESMLASQAQTLDVLFNNLTSRSLRNMAGGHLGAAETYFRMALKAQSQCRTTLETLNEIKFPKTPTFIRQQNIANQQQVNNGAPAATAHEKDVSPTNKLLEKTHGQRLDAGAPRAAIANDPHMETVGLLNGTNVRGRQAAQQRKRT